LEEPCQPPSLSKLSSQSFKSDNLDGNETAFGTRPQVKRRYDSFRLTSEKGKKQSEEDIKKRRRVIELKYWFSNPLESFEDELLGHLRNSKQSIKGFKFPLLDTPAIAACFLADHGNIAWRAGMITVIASEQQDGQGEHVRVAHLLGKDSYDMLASTAQPSLNYGLSYLQDSTLLVIRNNVDAENEEDIKHEGLLVPPKTLISSYAQPFQKVFMTQPIDQGNAHQKVLVDSMQWKSIEQTNRLLYDPTTKQIAGVSWQNIDREEVEKEFLDGGVVRFSALCTLEMFPVVVLGGEDTKWVACALGKENMAGAHCNHCQRSKKDFHLGRAEAWTLALIAAMSRTFRGAILPAAAGRKNKPTGYNGIKHPSLFCTPFISGFLRFSMMSSVL
jgi:hypothetical protein